MSLSPSQRTIRELKDRGIICGVVERWIPNPKLPGGGMRKDFLNIIDIVALDAGAVLGIQCTGASGFAEHDRKILSSEMSIEWLKAGAALELWSWRRVKLRRGSKALRWKPRIKRYELSDFDEGETDD